MYAKSIRPSAKREVQEERSTKRAIRMCPRSGQIFFHSIKFNIPNRKITRKLYMGITFKKHEAG